MLPEDQETRLRCFRNALRNWAFEGYITPKFTKKGDRPHFIEWLESVLPNYGWRDICRELQDHVQNGGEIDEQVETRPEYASYEFHYDLRVRIGGRHIYFEALLMCDDPDDADDPVIVVVNVHDV
jgi:hypothetical protein